MLLQSIVTMMSKTFKIALLVLILLLGIVLYMSLAGSVSVTAQKEEAPFNGLFRRFKWGPFKIEVNFSKIKEYPFPGRMWNRLEVSEEFKEKVINIAKSDPDVEKLLSEGYNITCIKPIIKTVIDADGNVTFKAKSAVLVLRKNTSGIAFVWIDVENNKVTRIEIITRTVIVKS